MDFEFNEEQRMVRDSLREFLDKEVAPIVDERDREGSLTKEEVIEWNKKFQQIGIRFDPETAKDFLSDPVFFHDFHGGGKPSLGESDCRGRLSGFLNVCPLHC